MFKTQSPECDHLLDVGMQTAVHPGRSDLSGELGLLSKVQMIVMQTLEGKK